jgi:DUF1680 family protein
MNFVPVNCVRLDDPLWSKQFEHIKDVVLPYMWEILNDRVEDAGKSHCIENFRIAAGQSSEAHSGTVFIDTDLYKWIEAVSYCISMEKDPELEALCDQAVDLVAAAQQPDGYLSTYYIAAGRGYRWTNLMEGHELYCAGHLIEAAVAHHEATGSTRLLDTACRFADLIGKTFGPGKMRGYPGHPEVELALIRLYGVTKNEQYLSLAEYFINERGFGSYLFGEECSREGHTYIFPEMAEFGADYFLADRPVRQQKSASGHAVRAMYLYSAMADLARLTGEAELTEVCERLYVDVTTRQMYVTGGIGSSRIGERFTSDYDLPSDAAYSETCASIGLMLLSSRMWLLKKDASFYDIWEKALYNTVLSGIGRDGRQFFYVNPLEVVPDTIAANPTLSHVKTQRQNWFGVACCPPNLARILASLRGFIYAVDDERLYILSHIGSSFEKGGLHVKLARDGETCTLTIDSAPIDIFLRLPDNSVLAGEGFDKSEDGYFSIHHPGGKKQYAYTLKPSIRVLRAHPSVSALSGQLCLQRGPSIYCVEGTDNTIPLSALRLPADTYLKEEKADWLDNGLPVIKAGGFGLSGAGWEKKLYVSRSNVYSPQTITFIPYSHWGNRGENEMRVWLNERL